MACGDWLPAGLGGGLGGARVWFHISSRAASQSQLWIIEFKDSKFVQAERDVSGVRARKAEERAALEDGMDRLGTRAPTA